MVLQTSQQSIGVLFPHLNFSTTHHNHHHHLVQSVGLYPDIFQHGGNTSLLNGTEFLSPKFCLFDDNDAYDEEADKEYIFDRLLVKVIFISVYTIVFCSCFFGNVAVILVVALHSRMRSITSFYLANLSFANLCVGVFCIYQNLSTYFMASWIFGNPLCKMYHFVNSMSHTSSILILVMICCERYLAILHPIRCRQILTLHRLRVSIVLVWTVSAIYCSPRLYYISTITIPRTDGEIETLCIPKRTLYDSHTFDLINFIALFIIPLTIITVLYTLIGITLWQSSSAQFMMTTPSPPPPAAATTVATAESSSTSIHDDKRLLNSFAIQQEKKAKAPMTRKKRKKTTRTDEEDRTNFCLENGGKGRMSCSSSCKMLSWCFQKVCVHPVQRQYQHSHERNQFCKQIPLTNCISSRNSSSRTRPTDHDSNQNNQTRRETPFSSPTGVEKIFPTSLIHHPPQQQQQQNKQPDLDQQNEIPTRSNSSSSNRNSNSSISINTTLGPIPTISMTVDDRQRIFDRVVKEDTIPIVLVDEDKNFMLSAQLEQQQVEEQFSFHPVIVDSGETVVERTRREEEKDLLKWSMSLKLSVDDDDRVAGSRAISAAAPPPGGLKAVTSPGEWGGVVEEAKMLPKKSGLNKHRDCDEDGGQEASSNLLMKKDKIVNGMVAISVDGLSSPPPPSSSSSEDAEDEEEEAEEEVEVPKLRLRRVGAVRATNCRTGSEALRSRRRIIRMLIIIVMTFTACNMPYHARKLWQMWSANYSGGSIFSALFTPFTFVCMYINCGLNPILFAFMSRNFRASFRDILSCRFSHRQQLFRPSRTTIASHGPHTTISMTTSPTFVQNEVCSNNI